MKVLIIEDEKPAARRLQRMLSKIGIEVDTMLHSVIESIEWFKNNKHPDLIFLDIQLSDGLSFEIFDHIKTDSAIIFTTAYDEYALKAFKLNSIDYLLKPIDEEELEAAIKKFRNTQQSSESINVTELRSLLNLPSIQKTFKSRFTAQVGQHLKLVNISDIACFYSENKATYIHCFSGRNYPVEIPLEQLEDELDPEKFYRINRKCILNIKAIKDIVSYTNSRLEIKLENFQEFQLIVSRERVKDFKTWLSN
ncbi:LytTR family DNA-binding domain-containing protein [Christiangramia sp. SM2212]|uniref:LytTR family DNA-binding domain-containing protein n=1 Tax=Christiangramia sediminicola TaxID=3073267 RepID=A0ABU1EPP3_9FLAO|nr:LytTR family DNA-binding domain-containing protein [Christiangramia sp. SM2212]MDR5589997.1 LytTR family DNA-binding domain-containing protein [Christiangramia sp. SM2212]